MLSPVRCLVLLCVASVCYGSPVRQAGDVLPINDVTFQLYTRDNQVGSRILIGNDSTLEGTSFVPNLPTKILVHGWMDDLNSGVVQILKRELLKLEPMNVIGVGWYECAHNVLYEEAVVCSRFLGEYIGELVVWLRDSHGLRPDNVHAIGHSLGGQAISFISRAVRIGHMSALDPAAPLFTHEDLYNRVDAEDADFVDVFHTSTKLVGMKNPLAHVDFYPNGGRDQPGCDDLFGACAHSSAYYFYGHTISEEGRNEYNAFLCDSAEDAWNSTCIGEPQAVMGYGVLPSTRGIFYFNTTYIPNDRY